MRKIDPTVTTVVVAATLAVAASLMLNWFSPSLEGVAASLTGGAAQAADPAVTRPVWAAPATARVEPTDGEVRFSAATPARIGQVIANTNDRVLAGDPLILLDSDELQQKLIAARSEEQVRIRERDEEPATGPALERRQAEDKLSIAQRAQFDAQKAYDDAYRQAAASDSAGNTDAVASARDKLAKATKAAADAQAALDTVNAKTGMPLPTRLESAVTIARTDIAQVENAIDRTRIRAPQDGAVLNVWAKVGEIAAPSVDAPLLLFGDISSLRVKAEVEERDVTKIRIGQRAVVRADAFPDKDFEGVVTQMAPALGTPRITTRGPRRPNDVEVLEVIISLDGTPPLLTGMRVDAFFRHEASAAATPTPPQQ
jgi:HlyD family secretion protein